MGYPGMAVGLQIGSGPPLGLSRAMLLFARLSRLDSAFVVDHFQGFVPIALWDRELSWAAAQFASPHEVFDYQVLLGYLARSAGGLRLGVGVTEPVRRHPVLIAQAMMTLAHMTKHPPILGIGAGERENIEPYGLDFSQPVGRLEEALKIIRLCFTSRGPFDFTGNHYRLDRAVMDLQPPKGRTPEIWIAGHGPRMLRLTGQYADGWYPTMVASPQEYKAKLDIIQAAAREAGRDPASITPVLHQFVAVAPSKREARAMLHTKVARFATLIGAPAGEWRKLGLEHPFGDQYRGYVDFIPEQYDRETLDHAIAAVPPQLVGHGFIIGTLEEVTARLREFGQAGVRHVVISLSSAVFSRRAAIYGQLAIPRIARSLRTGSGRK
ncbi:MAG TPA: LLM class flavin-dependent oxidoreductase [Chloroflexia bacterium]